MKEFRDLVAALRDADGSCRDVNFEGPTWPGVDALIESLGRSFTEISARDGQGRALCGPNPETFSAAARALGYVHLVCTGGSGLLAHLQVFVSREDDGTPFVELTFFPNDLAPAEELRRAFLDWADEMRARLGARRYYARYENASWQFGDVGPASGVFLVSEPAAPDE